MKVILRLALRNLKEHKAKTAIIASFIVIGCALVILGNAFIENVNRGLEKDFRENYTGDITITDLSDEGLVYHLFGVEGHPWDGHIPQIAAITDIEAAEQVIQQTEEVKSYTKMVASKVFLMEYGKEVNLSDVLSTDNLDVTSLPIAFIFAGESSTYYDVFKGINLLEGTYPHDGKDEVLIDTQLKEGYERNYKKQLNVGDKVLILGANTDGVVREAVVCGIYTQANKNSAMFQTMYASPSFTRPFSDLIYGSVSTEELEINANTELASLSEDDLFGDFSDDFFDIEEDDSLLVSTDSFDFYNILGDTTERDKLNQSDDNSWNFIHIKLDNPKDAEDVIAKLNDTFTANGIKAKAINWKVAATTYTSTVEGINVIFNIMVIILAIVVFFIIMNTMTVSVVERTGEIGTMRAIGSEKSFVRALFFSESLIITVVSAIIGSFIAIIVASIINSFGINIQNSMAKIILGGGALHFTVTPAIVLTTIIVATLGSVLSNIYPVSSALKVSPLKALTKGSE